MPSSEAKSYPATNCRGNAPGRLALLVRDRLRRRILISAHQYLAHRVLTRPAMISRPDPRSVRRLEVIAVGCVFGVYVVGTIVAAALKPMWFDELVTYYIAGQPDLPHLWSIMATGIEQTPPVYHLLVHAANLLLGRGELATRLPSILGMTAAAVAIFLFLRPRVSGAGAVIGAAV